MASKVQFLVSVLPLCPLLGLFQLMDLVSFYILPSQIKMSAHGRPVWTLALAKIWLADITATVFGDGPDRTVTSVSISSLFFSKKKKSSSLSFHWRPSPSGHVKTSHFQDSQLRCSLSSLTFPTCGNPFLSPLGKTQLAAVPSWLNLHASTSLRIQCMPSHNLSKVYLALSWLH